MENPTKRQRLIDAAYEVFAAKGYNSSSVRDVADVAGITPGLVHYYFASKEELLVAVQKTAQERYHQRYSQAEAPTDPTAVLEEIKSRVLKDPEWYRWRYELYALGLKGGRLQQEAAEVLEHGRASLCTQLSALLPDEGEAQHLAAVLIACFDGLALQKLLDGSFDLDGAYAALSGLLGQYLGNKGTADRVSGTTGSGAADE